MFFIEGGTNILVEVNSPIMPEDRVEIFEIPLINLFYEDDAENKFGDVSTADTFTDSNNQVIKCDIYLILKNNYFNQDTIERIKNKLEKSNIPKGSFIVYEKDNITHKLPIGKTEGVRLILDGINLPNRTYKKYGLNDLIENINTVCKGRVCILGKRTLDATSELYIYGENYNQVVELIQPITQTFPLCKNSIIEPLQTSIPEKYKTNMIVGSF